MDIKLGTWQTLGKLKVEFGLLLLCVLQFIRIPILLARNGTNFKDIYEGMNVDFSTFTQIMITLSDIIVSWWFVFFPLILILALGVCFIPMKLLMQKTAQNPDSDSTIQFQYSTIALSLITLVALSFINELVTNAMMAPLLKIVNIF